MSVPLCVLIPPPCPGRLLWAKVLSLTFCGNVRPSGLRQLCQSPPLGLWAVLRSCLVQSGSSISRLLHMELLSLGSSTAYSPCAMGWPFLSFTGAQKQSWKCRGGQRIKRSSYGHSLWSVFAHITVLLGTEFLSLSSQCSFPVGTTAMWCGHTWHTCCENWELKTFWIKNLSFRN